MLSTTLDGMFAIYDPRVNKYWIYNKRYFDQSVTPASTFNITTTLICLEEGLLKDEKSAIKFDGIHKSRNPEANKDITIEFAFKRNIDWAFLSLRKMLGNEKLKSWISRLEFGNKEVPSELDTAKTINGKTDEFWVVPGTLRITPAQQIGYIRKLKEESLPFSSRNMQIVKRMMYLKDTGGYKIFGRQGSYKLLTEDKYIGWHIGWIEKDNQVFFYANYLESPDLAHPSIVNAQKEIPFKIFGNIDSIGAK